MRRNKMSDGKYILRKEVLDGIELLHYTLAEGYSEARFQVGGRRLVMPMHIVHALFEPYEFKISPKEKRELGGKLLGTLTCSKYIIEESGYKDVIKVKCKAECDKCKLRTASKVLGLKEKQIRDGNQQVYIEIEVLEKELKRYLRAGEIREYYERIDLPVLVDNYSNMISLLMEKTCVNREK
jgi:hypothetical protein